MSNSTRVIGSIGPEADIREAPAFIGQTRNLEVSDATGRLHGRVHWLSQDMDEAFHAAFANLCGVAMRSARSGGADAAS